MKPHLPFLFLAASSALLWWFAAKPSENPKPSLSNPPPRNPSGKTAGVEAPSSSSTDIPNRTVSTPLPAEIGEHTGQTAITTTESTPQSRRERFKALSERLRHREPPNPTTASTARAVPTIERATDQETGDGAAGSVLDLGPGVQLPAIFLDTTPGRTPQIEQAKENLARTFEEELTQELANIPIDDEIGTARAYQKARARSDELYRALFGEAAYMRLGIDKAREAAQNFPGTP